MTDSTTVNLFKLASAVLAQREGAIVTDRGNFPTDRYVLEGLARAHDRELIQFEADARRGPSAGRRGRGVRRAGGVAHLPVPRGLPLRSAGRHQARITGEAPAPLIWDLSHSAGAVPIELNRWGVELAVGCTYKYLNGGPGAPAYLYLSDRRSSSSCERPSRAGSASAISSRWSAAVRPRAGRPRLARGDTVDPRHHRGRARRPADRRGRDAGHRRQGQGAHQLPRRAARRGARAAGASSSAPRAIRRSEGRT